MTQTTSEHHEGVRKLRRIENGLKLICEDEHKALKIKETININKEASEAVKVRKGNIRRKKVMIFHVPEYVTKQQITQKIKKTTELGDQTSEDAVILHGHLVARGG